MAENKELRKEATVKHGENVEHTEAIAVRRRQRPAGPLLTLAIFAGVVTLALIIVSWLLVVSTHRTNAGRMQYGNNQMSMDGNRGMSGQNGGFGGGGSQSRGSRITPSASGVISAISGDTITVIGSGKQVTVTRTSSTAISGDKTDIAVNDTVSIAGTTNSDGSITATRITVRNTVLNRATSDTTPDTSDVAPGA